MYEIFDEIEGFLRVVCCAVFSENNVKFYRAHRKHQFGEYTCIVRNNFKNVDATLKLLENILNERRPLWKKFLKFSMTDGRISLFFDRALCFTNGIKYVLEFGEHYGSNNLIEKIFTVGLDNSYELHNITYLRGKLVADILRQLIKTSGGTIVENGETEMILGPKPNYELKISSRHTENSKVENIIFVKIGNVLNGNNSNAEPITVNDYYKLRMEEINAMCDYKLEVNSVTTNREDLVQATVVFDLIQSNIHKAMTLHLQTQNPSTKTSCKGALFVMYNYVRLDALIAKFEYFVSCEKYLPLPPLEEIDFSFLSQDIEWALMYDYVLYWPLVVKQAFEQFEDGKPKIHNICQFLMNFSSDFSIYYHRTRILTDPRPHLKSLLHARIYFLKAVAQVYKNALNLIRLRPLNRM